MDASDRLDDGEDLSGGFAEELLDLIFGPRPDPPGDGASAPRPSPPRAGLSRPDPARYSDPADPDDPESN